MVRVAADAGVRNHGIMVYWNNERNEDHEDNEMVTAVWCSGVLAGWVSLHCRGTKKRIGNLYTLAAAILFLSCNNSSPDELNLGIMYDYGMNELNLSGVLYSLLVMLARQLSVSFSLFNFLTAAAALILIVHTLSRYTHSWGFALGLYLMSGAILDVSLYRQFLASAFVVCGFQYLITEQKQPGKYVLCIVLAASIHLAMAVYLIFGILGLEGRIRSRFYFCIIRGAFIGSAALSVLTLLNHRVIPGIMLLERLIGGRDSNKLEGYIQSAGGRYGWLLSAMLWILSVYAVYLFLKGRDTASSGAVVTYMREIKNIFALSICFLPFCIMMAVVFSRLYRPMVWLVILMASVLAQEVPEKVLDVRVAAGTGLYLGYYFLCFNGIFADWKLFTEMIFQGTLFWIQGA